MARQETSIEGAHRVKLAEVDWDDLIEPGAYVELGTGDLYRFPKEALIPGGSLVVTKESHGASRLIQVSKDPYVTTMRARLICAQHNVEPNF
ncbi:hypothetical protein QNA08_16970 [Chelatococcus sp. SYSU_G07232]|uniref:Uncharacterized protein n=1 Tax=Chelatococcus albus TaxID=3047466 RepID=A0ABT7AKL2_9HYPH|nr:hypothetical protein [Chelatococcus sp. SYSU_G07232]MDJ1159912.1 hypothetical protein [Chelatococcus sp. SYSU_G07232]